MKDTYIAHNLIARTASKHEPLDVMTSLLHQLINRTVVRLDHKIIGVFSAIPRTHYFTKDERAVVLAFMGVAALAAILHHRGAAEF